MIPKTIDNIINDLENGAVEDDTIPLVEDPDDIVDYEEDEELDEDDSDDAFSKRWYPS